VLKPYYYDVLIFDIKMPIMNGYELYEKEKKLDDKVKVCFLTNTILKSSKSRFLISSLVDNISFIRKPIMLDELVKKVNEIITRADNQ
jgi:DNA-binding response OmpR family regulator